MLSLIKNVQKETTEFVSKNNDVLLAAIAIVTSIGIALLIGGLAFNDKFDGVRDALNSKAHTIAWKNAQIDSKHLYQQLNASEHLRTTLVIAGSTSLTIGLIAFILILSKRKNNESAQDKRKKALWITMIALTTLAIALVIGGSLLKSHVASLGRTYNQIASHVAAKPSLVPLQQSLQSLQTISNTLYKIGGIATCSMLGLAFLSSTYLLFSRNEEEQERRELRIQ